LAHDMAGREGKSVEVRCADGILLTMSEVWVELERSGGKVNARERVPYYYNWI